MKSFAVLIDGGFIRRRLGTQQDPLDAQGIAEFVQRLCAAPELTGMGLHRVYYYDATPLTRDVTKPLRGGSFSFGESKLARFSHNLYSQLAKQPFFSLRLGVTAFRGWKLDRNRLAADVASLTVVAEDLRPDVHQKGVDMRLGMDVAALTLKKHVQVVVLVAGDSDFVPAMKFARREGVQFFLAPLGHAVRPEVVEHSDLVIDVK